MAGLAVNGVALPVLAGSLEVSKERVGSVTRNHRGNRVLDRRAIKRTFDFTLAAKSIDEANLYRVLVEGEGEHWTCNSSPYGDKGLQLTGTGAVVGGACLDPYGVAGGFQVAQTGAQTMIIPRVGPDQSAVARSSGATYGAIAARLGQTVVGWRGVGTAGTNAISAWRAFAWSRKAAEVPTVKREQVGALGASGAVQAYSGGETFSIASLPADALTVTMGGLSAGQAATFFSLWAFPWYFPQAQVDQLLAGFVSLLFPQPQLPGVMVASELFPDTQLLAAIGAGSASMVCHGEVSSTAARRVNAAGVATYLAMVGQLVEV